MMACRTSFLAKKGLALNIQSSKSKRFLSFFSLEELVRPRLSDCLCSLSLSESLSSDIGSVVVDLCYLASGLVDNSRARDRCCLFGGSPSVILKWDVFIKWDKRSFQFTARVYQSIWIEYSLKVAYPWGMRCVWPNCHATFSMQPDRSSLSSCQPGSFTVGKL